MVDEALKALSHRFDTIYNEEGRKSIPPERLLRALLLQMLYSVSSERMLIEQLEYNLLFRGFVGPSANEPVCHPTVFTKNRDRLLEGAVAEEFLSLILGQARKKRLLSDDHFTVDGTLIEAWAGQKSFRRKSNDNDPLNPPPPDQGSNPTVNWHKQKRSNQTHESRTDPLARLYKKTRGAETKLGCLGHVLTENRHGLVVDVRLTQATGTAERETALEMIAQRQAALRGHAGRDRGYDTRGFVAGLRALGVTPHVAQNDANRRSAIAGRTTRHEGYAVRERKRISVEEVFGWIKTVAMQRKIRFRGTDRVGWIFTFAAAAYNLVRMGNLEAATAVERSVPTWTQTVPPGVSITLREFTAGRPQPSVAEVVRKQEAVGCTSANQVGTFPVPAKPTKTDFFCRGLLPRAAALPNRILAICK